jgi:hypothetical protein
MLAFMVRWVHDKFRPAHIRAGLLVLVQPLVEVMKIVSGFADRPNGSQIALTCVTAVLVGMLACFPATNWSLKKASIARLIRALKRPLSSSSDR